MFNAAEVPCLSLLLHFVRKTFHHKGLKAKFEPDFPLTPCHRRTFPIVRMTFFVFRTWQKYMTKTIMDSSSAFRLKEAGFFAATSQQCTSSFEW